MPVDARVLVTGGAGFIGSWVVEELLRDETGDRVVVLDNLSNGAESNLDGVRGHGRFGGLVVGDIRDAALLDRLFAEHRFHAVYHLAACINVQESIDDPRKVFEADVVGTFELLERARRYGSRFVFTSTCMVYDRCRRETGIHEQDAVKPASPYAAAKLSGESMALGHYHAYGLPVVVLRPFNTYGPRQKATGEGGVVSIFCQAALAGRELRIYGDGTQTRDLLFAEDCARFIAQAGRDDRAVGRVWNAGSGRDIAINDLAALIAAGAAPIRHVPHIHPQSEIMTLRCDYSAARETLGWNPQASLSDGIARTRDWLRTTQEG